MRHMARRVSMTVFLGMLLAAPLNVFAQAQSVLTGQVKDASGAVLPGATVTLNSPQLLGGSRSVTTGDQGRYRFGELAPGGYELTFSLQGFSDVRRSGVRVEFGTTLTIDARLDVAGAREAIEVIGRAPITDVKTARASVTLDNEILQNLPVRNNQAGPNTADAINLAPGVTSARFAFGAPQNVNAYILDGVVTNELSGGGPAFVPVAHNWLEEVQMVALGAGAEYGGFTGVAANFVLKSGSNRFSGLAEYWTKRESWSADNRSDLPPSLQTSFRPQEIISNWDASAQIGGPIKKDKLFFFAGASFPRNDQSPSGALGNAVNKEHDIHLIGKLSGAPSSRLRVDGFVSYFNRDATSGARSTRQPETLGTVEQPSYNWNARATWTANDQTIIEAHYGGTSFTGRSFPIPPATLSGPPPRVDSFTGISSANVPSYAIVQDRVDVFTLSATRYLEHVLGRSHELKAGVEHARTWEISESGFPGGLSFTDVRGVPDQVTIRDKSITEASGRRYTAYVSDRWILNDQVTLEPGLRITANRGRVPSKGEVVSTTPIDPRIGIAWDVNGGHRTVVRAHYGRFHDALLTTVYSFLGTDRQPPTITARVLPNGSFQEINRVTPAANFGVDPDLTQSYMDQYLVGVERELLPNFGLQVQYVRRESKNFMAFLDTRSAYAETRTVDPGPDGVAGNTDDGSPLTVFNLLNRGQSFFNLTNPADAFRDYDAVQVIGRKRFSNNWQLLASYTWSKSRGSVDNVSGSNGAGGDAGRTGNFSNPNRAINREGRSTNDNTHQVKIQGTYRIPVAGGINFSAAYQYITGSGFSRTIVVRGLAQGNETVRVEPRGTLRADATNFLDLRLEKTLSLGGSRSIGVYVDGFNLLNEGAALTVIEAAGPLFGTPATFSEARSFRAGARYTF